MTTKRGTNPNSHEALRKATAAKKKDAKQVHITLSPEAIAQLDEAAKQLGLTRSGLVEAIAAKGWCWISSNLR